MSPAPRSLPVETLLADAGWVRRLAARLVADPGSADELAQQTLVAAWRHPPAEGTPARPWLARVLRNFARQKNRAAAAREAHERARPRGPAAPDDLLERAELAQRLARLVLELDEPYRTTVLQRFFEGWSAEQIARASGTTPSTVRTRLERALAQLRGKLERERGREWLAALMPLAKISGGIIVGTGAKVGIGVCVAALCGWLFWPRAQPLAPALEPLASVSTPAPERVEAPTEAEPRRELPASTPAPVAKPPALHVFPDEIAPGTIEGVVLRRHGDRELPIADAEVELRPRDAANAELDLPPRAHARSLADGSFRFANLAPGKWSVRAGLPHGPAHEALVTLPEKASAPPVRIVFGSTRLHGHVYDEQGTPLEHVSIRIEGGAERAFAVRARTQTDRDGSWSLSELPAGRFFGMIGDDFSAAWPGRMLTLTLVDGDDVELDCGARRALGHWRGTVRTALGEPVKSGGTLHLERGESTRLGSEALTYREVLFDQSGRFDVALEPASWRPGVSLASKSEVRRMFDALRIGKDDLEHDIVLSGTRLSGTVFDSVTLQPLAGYAGILQVSVGRPGSTSPSSFQTVNLDEAAHFAIDTLEEGAWELRTFPLKVAAGGAKLGFTIARGQTELQLDVQVQKP